MDDIFNPQEVTFRPPLSLTPDNPCAILAFVQLKTKGKNMTYKITTDCISCGACEAECPENAISEGDGIYVIDPAKCQDCGSCAEVCPTGSCVPA
jgi:ferredoxin